jgi:hypothetical protein
MKTRCDTRTPRRYRRPVPLPATRSQIRQKVINSEFCTNLRRLWNSAGLNLTLITWSESIRMLAC